LGLTYVVGVTGQVTVWPPGRSPLPARQAGAGGGRPPKRQRIGLVPEHQPQSIKELAFTLPARQWRTVQWREGSNFTLSSRFARVRVQAAHRDPLRTHPREPQWLLVEWPEGHKEPMKYWLSTLSEDTPLQRMVFEAKMRWRIERDYQDLKQDLGLGDFEGRGWRGFHHHATMSIAAYGFLMAQRLRHPQGGSKKNSAQHAQHAQPALPTHYRPRGSPAHAAPRPIVHNELTLAYCQGVAPDAATLSVLPSRKSKATLLTQ